MAYRIRPRPSTKDPAVDSSFPVELTAPPSALGDSIPTVWGLSAWMLGGDG